MMNLRVVIVLLAIFIFAFSFGALSYLQSEGLPLKQAYDDGNVLVVQNTTAGTVPHEVVIKNNGSEPVNVEVGDLLTSENSQDLVLAEDKRIPSNSTKIIKAYCFEPNQRAEVGSELTPSNKTSDKIKQVIDDSDPYNLQNAIKAQSKIWVIVSGGDVDPYSGEALALVEKQGISFSQLQQNIYDAKLEVMSQFNISSEEIKSLAQNQTESTSQQIQGWIEDIIKWTKESLGIGS